MPGRRATSPDVSAERSARTMSPLRRDHAILSALQHQLATFQAAAAAAGIKCDRLARTLDACRDGVVVVDADGVEVYRNPAAERYRAARHADAVVAGNIAMLLDEARTGTSWERDLGL